MKLRTSQWIILALIVISIIVSIVLVPYMPQRMASHWNMQGEVDGTMSRFWGLFLLPMVSVFLFLLFILIPKIDPLKANIQKFQKHYDGFVFILMLFLSYIYVLTLLWNRGIHFNMTRLMVPAFAALLFCSGMVIERAKQNWFIGIRTPWTLSSERVWERTHKLGGKLFKVAGIISVIGIVLPDHGFYFILLPIVLISLVTVIFSYVEFKKEKNH